MDTGIRYYSRVYYNMSRNVLFVLSNCLRKRPKVNIYTLLLAKMQKCVIWQKVTQSSGVHTMSQGGGNTFHKV